MTTQEMSDFFGLLSNAYQIPLQQGQDGYLVFDEYEKSLYLTMAQNMFVISCYNGKNQYDYKFEVTEEDRRILDSLVRTRVYETDTQQTRQQPSTKIVPEAVVFRLPADMMFITYESVKFSDSGCASTQEAVVVPVTQDEFWKTYKNPFRGPNERRVLRLDSGDNTVELVSKKGISEYKVRYLKKTEPIILVDMPETSDLTMFDGRRDQTPCQLDSSVHEGIVELAVNMALQRKSIGNSKQ